MSYAIIIAKGSETYSRRQKSRKEQSNEREETSNFLQTEEHKAHDCVVFTITRSNHNINMEDASNRFTDIKLRLYSLYSLENH